MNIEIFKIYYTIKSKIILTKGIIILFPICLTIIKSNLLNLEYI